MHLVQRRCTLAMKEISSEGRTEVLLVSPSWTKTSHFGTLARIAAVMTYASARSRGPHTHLSSQAHSIPFLQYSRWLEHRAMRGM